VASGRVQGEYCRLDGVWRVASEAREKGNIGEVRLPKLALDIIRAQPQFDGGATSSLPSKPSAVVMGRAAHLARRSHSAWVSSYRRSSAICRTGRFTTYGGRRGH
jgi:hypothetical protein